jgi:2-hydroxychromene-2-carboxylate isomerase
MKEVEFFFDLGSPYSYLAYHRLPVVAAARAARIAWRPILLGGVFQSTGNSSPAAIPAKGRYLRVDLQRWAAHFAVPFQFNPHFPINTLALMRAATGLQMRGDEDLQRYLAAIYAAMFEKPRDLNRPEELAAVLAAAGFAAADVLAITQDPAVKAKLRADTESAVERGVFGAPTFFVDGEMYWGQDRLEFVDRALARA